MEEVIMDFTTLKDIRDVIKRSGLTECEDRNNGF